jgi:hypothetical protein
MVYVSGGIAAGRVVEDVRDGGEEDIMEAVVRGESGAGREAVRARFARRVDRNAVFRYALIRRVEMMGGAGRGGGYTSRDFISRNLIRELFLYTEYTRNPNFQTRCNSKTVCAFAVYIPA